MFSIRSWVDCFGVSKRDNMVANDTDDINHDYGDSDDRRIWERKVEEPTDDSDDDECCCGKEHDPDDSD